MRSGELTKQLIANAETPVGGRETGVLTAPLPFEPFPVHVLPASLRTFVEEGARAIGCDPAMIALPVLTVCAAAIGTTRRVRLRDTWSEPSVLWTLVVAPSGSLKSPALDFAVEPLREAQDQQFRDYEQRAAAYENDVLRYEVELKAWKNRKAGAREHDLPSKPIPPACVRYMVSDCTIESLAPILMENPRGIVLVRDEASGWLKSFDQYKPRGGSDLSNWLELHRAGAITVDRKHGVPRTIHVRGAAVSICGTIQPGTLRRLLTTEFFESGLAARLLLACPAPRRKVWHKRGVSPAVRAAYAQVVERLLRLKNDVGDDGNLTPIDVPLSAEAEAAWSTYYNQLAYDQITAPDEAVEAALAKIEGGAARLALICQLAASAAESGSQDVVGVEAMRAGIAIARWHEREARRIYATFQESDGDRGRRELVEYIRRWGGTITERDLANNRRNYRNNGAARAALDDLVAAGLGEWTSPPPGPKGGRPSNVFALLSSRCAINTPDDAIVGDGLAVDDGVAASGPGTDNLEGSSICAAGRDSRVWDGHRQKT